MLTCEGHGHLQRVAVQMRHLDYDMMDIYMALPSNRGGKESDTTSASASFKMQLAEQLILKENHWEVTVASA